MIFRQAQITDAESLCAILNPIIKVGGTTAQLVPLSETQMIETYINNPAKISLITAVEDHVPIAFQILKWAQPGQLSYLPDTTNWTVIASFAHIDRQASGVGSKMFQETLKMAQDNNVKGIDATIRADNTPGLKYYSRCGFKDFAFTPNQELADGTKVDRIHKIYELSSAGGL